MATRLRSSWQKIRKLLAIIGIIAACIGVIVLVFVEVRLYGTGFVGKTLWDWLGLLAALAIPVVVGLGAAWYTAQQGKVSARENKDNQREAALQAYIDSMSELLLHEKLRDSAGEDEVRTIARVRTLTVLRGLDAMRKASVLQFLYESALIDTNKRIIDLSEANLGGADLSFTDFSGANLSYAVLSGANLSGASLYGVYLIGANLSGANLSGANLLAASLLAANLKDAIGITTEELEKQTKLLQDVTMPNGSKHS